MSDEKCTCPQLGATGEFPEGRLNADDEGALRLAVAANNGMVEIHFGTPVAWTALSPTDALGLAEVLGRVATQAARQAALQRSLQERGT